MKAVNRLLLAVSFMFASVANANVILSLDPATQTANSGDMVSVVMSIDGLADFGELSLAAFDIDVSFDTSVLSFAGYSLGDGLELGLFDSLDVSDGEYFPGVVNVREISSLFNEELNFFQPGSFALAELFFTINPTETHKTTDINFTFAQLVEASGDASPINVVGVNNASISVPAPSALLLMSLGLLAMVVRQKRKQAAF